MAVSSLYISGYSYQDHIWKLVNALVPMKTWIATISNQSGNLLVLFTKDSTVYIQACLRECCVLLVGPVHWKASVNSLSCMNYCLYTCLSANTTINFPQESVYLLRACVGLWLPVKLEREWEESLSTRILHTLLKNLKKKTG